MISFDFEYYRPGTVEEAAQLHRSLRQQGKRPRYYSGGTEITTLGRLNQVQTGAVIDLKGITDCHTLQLEKQHLVMGACVSLNKLKQSQLFPLLGQAICEVADHTARTNITLGGNLCSQIIYRESVLPLLLSDSQVRIAGEEGIKEISIHAAFQKEMQLSEGEFILQVLTEHTYLTHPFYHKKRRKQGSVGYPVVTVSAMKVGEQVRLAFSGLCAFPFRNEQIEQAFNQRKLPLEERITQVMGLLPSEVLEDSEGSAGFRRFVLHQALLDVGAALEGGDHV